MSKYPTTEQVLRLFNLAEGHALLSEDEVNQLFQPQLTELQKTVLHLSGAPLSSYRIAAR